ncbi:glycosyltransferase [Thermodesulfatator atlanticus]|uniref:glycosyltransferase n=1 Tax=Thermodesulfatator atlanticus TaxID=501497 RepID=UPI001C564C49|nr:glycosyltransferase [Thermodesulfatator atlanticus]
MKKKFRFHGGAEQYLKRLLNALTKENSFDIHLLSQTWDEKVTPNVVIHTLPKIKAPLSDLVFALQVKGFLKKYKFDLVFSFDRILSDCVYRASDGCHLKWLAQKAKFSSKIKGLDIKYNIKHKSIAWLEKQCLKKARKIIANSRMVKNDFKTVYNREIAKNIVVIYNGIDVNYFDPNKIALSKCDIKRKDEIILGFIGSDFFRKGLGLLLKALSNMSLKARLVVIGRDKKQKHYQRLVKKLGLQERILFLGAQKDIRPYLKNIDVFVLPTLYDPFANTCLESLSFNVPVVTSTFNGAHEIIDEGADGMIASLDVNDLSRKIEKACKIKSFSREKIINHFKIEDKTKEIVKLIKENTSYVS